MYHPSSNGLAERAVQTFKSAVNKLEGPMEVRISKFLFKYRVTPQTTTGLSPAQLLMGRRLRTHLDLLHPDTSKKAVEKQQMSANTEKTPRTFKIGDKLFARNFHGTKWIPVVVSKVSGPLSYHVKSDDGVTLRRHVDHLRIRYSESLDQPKPTGESDDWILMPGQVRSTHLSNSSEPVSVTLSPTVTSPPVTQPVRQSTRTRHPVDRYSPSR